jgi:hypothetical protein
MSKCYDNPEYDKIDDNLQNTWKQSKYVEPKQVEKEIMKNIHILPTDQPSRLVKIKDTFFITSSVDIPGGTFYNIYITSNEEIKEGDWVFNFEYDYIVQYDSKKHDDKFWYKKIILITDPTLIADGVQAIDDEFLKWFVKNPSCEFVDVKKQEVILGNYDAKGLKKIYDDSYKIIIPQEEPKQETLEEQMYRASFENESPLWHDGFIAGGKYMTERMYSEEDLRQAYIVGKHGGVNQTYYDFDEWFKQFKKK